MPRHYSDVTNDASRQDIIVRHQYHGSITAHEGAADLASKARVECAAHGDAEGARMFGRIMGYHRAMATRLLKKRAR